MPSCSIHVTYCRLQSLCHEPSSTTLGHQILNCCLIYVTFYKNLHIFYLCVDECIVRVQTNYLTWYIIFPINVELFRSINNSSLSIGYVIYSIVNIFEIFICLKPFWTIKLVTWVIEYVHLLLKFRFTFLRLTNMSTFIMLLLTLSMVIASTYTNENKITNKL